jgi:hypothetical protein
MSHPSSSSMKLEYEPFTENRWWPSGRGKIARLRPPATTSRTPRGSESRPIALARAALALQALS